MTASPQLARPSRSSVSKAGALSVLSVAELLAMSVWFSASAVVPALARDWSLDAAGQAWITMAVQAGFVAGALGSAILNLADRLPAPRLIAVSSLLASASTLAIPLIAGGLATAIPLRFLTGVFLAGVYPVGMKVVATWTKEDRGLGIGILVGALTIGSASPHLINTFGEITNWQAALYAAGFSALGGGILAGMFVQEGPFSSSVPPFNWKYALAIIRQKDIALANLGYLGHMWELYAMWAWIPLFILASFTHTGIEPVWARLASFGVIGAGGIGSLLAGVLADRWGRTTITIFSLVVSGLCSLIVGFLFGGNPFVLLVVCFVWGMTIVADSAQFSACISELCNPEYVGTALTIQTSLGFLLTLLTIRLIPLTEGSFGWENAFVVLAIGPAIGIWAMYRLRRSPSAIKLAGGRR